MVDLKTILKDYVAFIKLFEGKLKEKYNISRNPYLEKGLFGVVDSIGNVDGYEYHYHGGGCTVKWHGIICNYEVFPNRGTEVEFTLWSLTQFIGTNPKYSGYVINEDNLRMEIEDLVEKGALSMYEIGGRKFECYLIK